MTQLLKPTHTAASQRLQTLPVRWVRGLLHHTCEVEALFLVQLLCGSQWGREALRGSGSNCCSALCTTQAT
jgi:hypothetical protein